MLKIVTSFYLFWMLPMWPGQNTFTSVPRLNKQQRPLNRAFSGQKEASKPISNVVASLDRNPKDTVKSNKNIKAGVEASPRFLNDKMGGSLIGYWRKLDYESRKRRNKENRMVKNKISRSRKAKLNTQLNAEDTLNSYISNTKQYKKRIKGELNLFLDGLKGMRRRKKKMKKQARRNMQIKNTPNEENKNHKNKESQDKIVQAQSRNLNNVFTDDAKSTFKQPQDTNFLKMGVRASPRFLNDKMDGKYIRYWRKLGHKSRKHRNKENREVKNKIKKSRKAKVNTKLKAEDILNSYMSNTKQYKKKAKGELNLLMSDLKGMRRRKKKLKKQARRNMQVKNTPIEENKNDNNKESEDKVAQSQSRNLNNPVIDGVKSIFKKSQDANFLTMGGLALTIGAYANKKSEKKYFHDYKKLEDEYNVLKLKRAIQDKMIQSLGLCEDSISNVLHKARGLEDSLNYSISLRINAFAEMNVHENRHLLEAEINKTKNKIIDNNKYEDDKSEKANKKGNNSEDESSKIRDRELTSTNEPAVQPDENNVSTNIEIDKVIKNDP